MYYKIGKVPNIRSSHNLESWNKIKGLIGSGWAKYDEIVNSCIGHNFSGGAELFVKYCISNGWLISTNTTNVYVNNNTKNNCSKSISKQNVISNVTKNSGLYLVTLSNVDPISVNATDKRIATTAIKVTKANCKLGKAENFIQRENYYRKIFENYLNFKPLALVEVKDLKDVEQKISSYFDNFKIRGRTGRKNEWMENIKPSEVIDIVKNALQKEYPDHIWVYDN